MLDSKFHNAVALSYRKGSAGLVSDVRDNKCDGVDGSISMNGIISFEPDLFTVYRSGGERAGQTK